MSYSPFAAYISTLPFGQDIYQQFADQGIPPSPPTVDYLLLESGFDLLQEDGIFKFLLEDDDGNTSLLLLASGFYILQTDSSHIKTASSV